ncbi:hypothetical protein BGC07_15280 [Piscirickettsia litoralis]|uniref:Uncharacterized protein n=2 Tax=Piscirickettsia litoralis TaxID=1891921 RepID=A0ABX2ZZ40_9GAMM|nr:hypothetical protein BGC07_15280 [Piscirickettsia litoralis]
MNNHQKFLAEESESFDEKKATRYSNGISQIISGAIGSLPEKDTPSEAERFDTVTRDMTYEVGSKVKSETKSKISEIEALGQLYEIANREECPTFDKAKDIQTKANDLLGKVKFEGGFMDKLIGSVKTLFKLRELHWDTQGKHEVRNISNKAEKTTLFMNKAKNSQQQADLSNISVPAGPYS